MQQNKFEAMVREFPFLKQVFAEAELTADTMSGITVARGDRNLLEMTPAAWSHDAGGYGEVSGYRSYWFVTDKGEVGRMDSAWCRTLVPHGVRSQDTAEKISVQLASLNKEVPFIVEIHDEKWDGEEFCPNVTIYKMHAINSMLNLKRDRRNEGVLN